MVELACSLHPEFETDCTTDPEALVEHWQDGPLRIDYVNSLVDSKLRSDSNVFYENDCQNTASDLLGLFSPALRPRRLHRIQVQFPAWQQRTGEIYKNHRDVIYPMRRYFTLLHEIGHYLQQTDDELAERLMSISSTNYNKKFEEGACNKFASLSLLPTSYLMQQGIDLEHFSAQDVADFFDKDKKTTQHWGPHVKVCRVSRQVVVRRFADFLPSDGYTALLYRKRVLDVPHVVFRTYGDGHVEYDLDASTAEQQAVQHKSVEDYYAKMQLNFDQDPPVESMTVSSQRRNSPYWDVVVYRPKT